MKNTRRHLVLGLIFTVLFLIVAACSLKTIRTTEKGNLRNCHNRVLVASQNSDFKNEVVDQLIDSLTSHYCYLKLIDIGSLKTESPDDYEAIALVDTIKMMSLSDDVADFLDRAPDKSRITVLTTMGDATDGYEIDQVDAVASASELTDSKLVAASVSARVKRNLQED